MRSFPRKLGLSKLAPVAVASALLCPVFVSGCTPAPTYTDADHGDTHRWDSHEADLYAHWEQETHRPHVEFNRRADPEKKEYWDWRHKH